MAIFRLFSKTSLLSKNCCCYFLGNFWKHLGNFLLQHLVTLDKTKSKNVNFSNNLQDYFRAHFRRRRADVYAGPEDFATWKGRSNLWRWVGKAGRQLSARHHSSCSFFSLMGQPQPLFCLFSFLKFYRKVADFSGIRTRMA